MAWKMTVDMRLGLFAVTSDDSCSVPGCHVDDYQPPVINISPHNMWTRVRGLSSFQGWAVYSFGSGYVACSIRPAGGKVFPPLL